MKESYLAQQQVEDIMNRVGGSIFTIKFRKNNGALRKINGRLNVTQYLSGGTKTTDPSIYQTVFDHTKQGYRCVNKSRVLSIRAMGETFKAAA